MDVVFNSDIARLVLGYLASQEQKEDKHKASRVFCKTNIHLREEYDAYKKGYNRVDTTIGLVALVRDYYTYKSLLESFIKVHEKFLPEQDLRDENVLKANLERVLSLLKTYLRPRDSQPGFERKRKMSNNSLSSINTSTPETKQPPKKRQRKVDSTPFVILGNHSEKRNPISVIKELDNDKRKELFSSSESSGDESNDIEVEPPLSNIKLDIPVVEDEKVEEDEKSPQTNVSLLMNRSKMIVNQTPSQALSTSFLIRPKFSENLAENINIMLQSKQEELNKPSTSAPKNVFNIFTGDIGDMIDEIIGMSGTDQEYREIANEAFAINSGFCEQEQNEMVRIIEANPLTPVESVPIALEQKDPKATYTLRDRKTTINYNEKKKKKKIKILSDEPYDGELPSCAKKFNSSSKYSKKKEGKSSAETSRSSMSIDANEAQEIPYEPVIIPETLVEQQQQQLVTMVGPMMVVGDQMMFNFPMPNFFQNNVEIVTLPVYPTNIDPNLLNVPSLPQIMPAPNIPVEMPCLIPLRKSAEKLPEISNVLANSEILAVNSNELPPTVQVVPQQSETNSIIQPKTPKLPRNLNYLNSKSKSTPRRKGSHIRILDFNTPSRMFHNKHNGGKLATIKEFSTPQGFMMSTAKTPSSAPPSMKSGISLQKIEKKKKPKEKSDEREVIADDSSSNSNSISNTPKVLKNPRKCRIMSHASESEDLLQVKDSLAEWNAMRKISSSNNWEQHLRLQNRVAKPEVKKNLQARKKKPIRKSNEPEVIESPDNESKIEARLIEDAIKSAKKEKDENDKNRSTDETIEINETVEISDTNGQANANIEIDKEPIVPPSIKKHQIKIKIDSPRKNRARKKTLQRSKEKMNRMAYMSKVKEDQDKGKEKETKEIVEKVEESPNKQLPSNRSECIKEVAATLSQLSTTILSKTVIPSISNLLETPLKLDLPTVPDTPRFLAPIGAHETPMLKFISNSNNVISVLKMCDIVTPNEPLTPGFSGTPFKSREPSPASANGGYSSRRTDYSSCSSYYKPDESEDINSKLDAMLCAERKTRKDSEQEQLELLAKKICVSAKKVECPGFVDKMKDALNRLPGENQNVHYTMLEPESSPTKNPRSRSNSSSSSSSSSSSCSSCSSSSSSSSSGSSVSHHSGLIHNIYPSEDASDTDYRQADQEQDVAEVVTNDGEVRFPIRNWITPKKNDYSTTTEDQSEHIKSLLHKSQEEAAPSTALYEDRVKQVAELEEKKNRVMRALKNSPPAKFRRPAKVKPLPISPPRPVSKKESILQRNSEVKQRAKPTPQLLSGRSSSKRKNPTPRKAVYLQAMPVTTMKRTTKKSPALLKTTKVSKIKSPSRPQVEVDSSAKKAVAENISNISDGSVISNISTVEETLEPSSDVVVDLKDTFHEALIKQGFNQTDATLLQKQFIEEDSDNRHIEDESPSKQSVRTETEDEEDELQMVSFGESSSNYFKVISETANQKSKEFVPSTIKIDSINFNIDGRKIVLSDSGLMDIFELPSEKSKSSAKRSSSRNVNKLPTPVKIKVKAMSPNPKQFKVKVHHKIRPEDTNYEKEKEMRAKLPKEIPDKKVFAKNENRGSSMNKDDKTRNEAPKSVSKQTTELASKPMDIVKDIDINAVLAQLHGFPAI